MGHKRRRLPSRGSIVLIEEDLIADHRGSPAGPHHDWIGIRRGRCPWLQEDLTSSKRASSRRPANGQRLTGYVVLPEKWISRVARHVQEPPSGAETCSCTTIQPCARFSRTIVHRPSKCDDAPCLLTSPSPVFAKFAYFFLLLTCSVDHFGLGRPTLRGVAAISRGVERSDTPGWRVAFFDSTPAGSQRRSTEVAVSIRMSSRRRQVAVFQI